MVSHRYVGEGRGIPTLKISGLGKNPPTEKPSTQNHNQNHILLLLHFYWCRRSFPSHTIVLVLGGLALGKAVGMNLKILFAILLKRLHDAPNWS